MNFHLKDGLGVNPSHGLVRWNDVRQIERWPTVWRISQRRVFNTKWLYYNAELTLSFY